MMHPQVLISSLILLLPATVELSTEVHGVVSHPVTLPCTYPVSNGISSMCWGRGACSTDTCGQTLLWTDGYHVYYRINNHYQLKGQLLQGNVSLTIENASESDSGLYCCRVQMKGWGGIQRRTISLQVQPGVPTSSPRTFTIGSSIKPNNRPTPRRSKTTPRRFRTTLRKPTTLPRRPSTTMKPTTTSMRPTTTTKPVITSTRPTQPPTSTRVSTSTPKTPAHMKTHQPGRSVTMTASSVHPWNNHTEVVPTQNAPKINSKGLCIGISLSIVFLVLVSTLIIAKCRHTRKNKSESPIFLHTYKNEVFQRTVQLQDEDKVYITEAGFQFKDELSVVL